MKHMDFNCFSGNWPFYRVRYNTVEKIAEKHRRLGIEGGYISSLEAIFYQDPYEAEQLLSQELKGTPYRHALTLNPALHGWQDSLHRALRDLDIQAIRLIPGYHGYRLTEPLMEEVTAELRACGLPLLLTVRVMDDRSVYGILPRPLTDEEILAFLEKNTDIPTVLCDIKPFQLAAYGSIFKRRENLFIDTSGFMAALFAVEEVSPYVADHIVFGSNAPLTELHSIYHIVETAEIDPGFKKAIYTGEKFLNLLK